MARETQEQREARARKEAAERFKYLQGLPRRMLDAGARDADLEDVDGGDSAVLFAASKQIREHFGLDNY